MSTHEPSSGENRDPPMEESEPSNLPVLAETRTYITIRPTKTPLRPNTIQTHFRRMYHLGETPKTGRLRRLLGRATTPPTIECLLISTGEAGGTLTYAFGIDDDEAIDALDGALRAVFPDTYEFERVDWTRDHVGGLLGADEDPAVAGVEFHGRTKHPRDWQTQLTAFDDFQDGNGDQGRVPLAAVVEAMADTDGPMVYQALLRPKPDWTRAVEDRCIDIEANHDTIGGQIQNVVFGMPDPDSPLPRQDDRRLEELEARDAGCSFDVNARFAAIGGESRRTLRQVAAAFTAIGHTSYDIEGRIRTGNAGRSLLADIRERRFHPPNYDRLGNRLPGRPYRSPGIVADVTETPSFCLLGGNALTAAGGREVAPTPGERTTLPRPPKEQLEAYREPGFTLGHPVTQDGTPDPNPVALPPSLQPLHIGLFGKTGAGKSSELIVALLSNHEATDGLSILLDGKGDGMPREYLQAHYAKYGTLENVLYFDCMDVLPALSFFDIRPGLAAGMDRATMVTDAVDHYIEILRAIMGAERFDRAVRSPDIIRYLVKAMFDPVHGQDAFTHRELQQAARRMHETGDAPPVVDEDLEVALGGIAASSKRSFDEIMQGVANRIEKVMLDDRLASVFNHVTSEGQGFDFADWLDEDVVIIIDTGGLRSESQRALTLVLLSNLWTALRRRAQADPEGDHALVNLYLEEAADVAATGLVTDLLAQSRGFGLSVTLAMQFPAQLRNADTEAYAEVLNNVSTLVTGNVAVDRDLATRLATDDDDREAVGNRLRALSRGQWLVSLPAAFGEPEPRPFLVESAPLPPGHPDGDQPLEGAMRANFETNFDLLTDRTFLEYGLDATARQSTPNEPSGKAVPSEAASALPGAASPERVDSALPYTNRLPTCIDYDQAAHAVRCSHCDRRYDPTPAGLREAIGCCYGLDRVDRDDIPIVDINLKLTPDERAASEYTDRQLAFLQVVFAAHRGQYDSRWEYDLLWDSMTRLQEYVGIDYDAVEELLEDGLLTSDCNHPHRLYTVTAAGRDEIQVSYRKGIDHGDGQGDLGESSLHRAMIQAGRHYIQQGWVENPESAAVEAVTYHEIDDGRLDAAGLDADGNVVVALEAERSNHDTLRAVPSDYDKMAAFDPEAAIWIVRNRDGAHDALEALNDPPEGPVRVAKTYSRNSPPQSFNIDEPGLTEMYTLQYLRDTFLEDIRPGA